MKAEYEPVKSPSGQKRSIRTILIMLGIAFIAGIILASWVITRFDLLKDDTPAHIAQQQPATPSSKAARELEKRISPDGTVKPSTLSKAEPIVPEASQTGVTPDLERALATRVADLEDRLSRINVQAQAASGNAARAEGLLIAFAARRALDRGFTLGYLADQLQLRFGKAKPEAVQTIIQASKNPVTLDQLRTQLEELAPQLTVGGSRKNETVWARIRREMSELFILRRKGSASPAPAQRMERALRFLENGRVNQALAEVDKLPGRSKAEQWMTAAQIYADARTALDEIETAAILEPRDLRTSEGEKVDQPSPLSPDNSLAETAKAKSDN